MRIVPGYGVTIGVVKKEAIDFSHFRLISWDFAIDEQAQALFIELNLKIDYHQLANGRFWALTDELLEEVF